MVEAIATGIGPCQHQASRRPPGMTNKEFFAALGLQFMKDIGDLPRSYKQVMNIGNDGFVTTKADAVSKHGSEEHTQKKQEETGNKLKRKERYIFRLLSIRRIRGHTHNTQTSSSYKQRYMRYRTQLNDGIAKCKK